MLFLQEEVVLIKMWALSEMMILHLSTLKNQVGRLLLFLMVQEVIPFQEKVLKLLVMLLLNILKVIQILKNQMNLKKLILRRKT